MKLHKHQSGIAHLALIVVFVMLAAIGFAGWRVYETNKAAKTSKSQNATPVAEEEKAEIQSEGWLTYKNEEAKITFQYPETWKSESADTVRYGDGEFGGVGGTLTSPDGSKLTWVFQTAGGKGGYCEPAPDDVAFKEGNKCPSKQIISFEKAQIVNEPSNSSFRTMYKDQLFITRTKYMGSDNNTTYQICLDPFYTSKQEFHNDETPQVGTSMGLLFACEYWSTGFNVKFDVKQEKDFDSADAKTAEKIMRTFNSL